MRNEWEQTRRVDRNKWTKYMSSIGHIQTASQPAIVLQKKAMLKRHGNLSMDWIGLDLAIRMGNMRVT